MDSDVSAARGRRVGGDESAGQTLTGVSAETLDVQLESQLRRLPEDTL